MGGYYRRVRNTAGKNERPENGGGPTGDDEKASLSRESRKTAECSSSKGNRRTHEQIWLSWSVSEKVDSEGIPLRDERIESSAHIVCC